MNGEANSEGINRIVPGNRIPLAPQHIVKLYADFDVTSKLVVNVGAVVISNSYARGNENNMHRPDGRLFLGAGETPGYAIVNSGARYRVHRRLEFFVQVNNLLNRKYYSAAQLGPAAFTAEGNFIARPFPAVDGVFPLQNATFFAPGAPRGVWGGIRLRY